MPKLRLTKRTVEALPYATEGQALYRDDQLTGFGLRVGRTSKVFFVEGQVSKRTKRVTIGRADVLSPEVARKRAVVLLAEMAEGTDPNEVRRRASAEGVSLAEAFESFFEARPHLSGHTVAGYGRTARLYLGAWAKRPLRAITRQMVLRKHQQIAEMHGPTTANNAMRHLRSVYNFVAATHDEFPPNPVLILTQARAWHREQRRRTLIAAHELPAWWAAAMREPDYARDFLLVALFTGMRRGEVARLRWEDIDLVGRQLHLPDTKNGDPLDLPLSGFLVDLLSARREVVGQTEWVFPGVRRDRHIVEVKKIMQRVSAASGVKFTTHDLRRTFITIAESLNIPHYALKRLLNHRTDSDVTGGYIVINAERLRDPVERIAARILELAHAEEGEEYRKPERRIGGVSGAEARQVA
ncbi:MAG: integrase family protein [Pseudomonadota bacterium]